MDVGEYFYLYIYIHYEYAETVFLHTNTKWFTYKDLPFPGPWTISLWVNFPPLSQVPDVVSSHPSTWHRKWETGLEIWGVGAEGPSETVSHPDTAVDTLGHSLSDLVTLNPF